ncbi:sugar transferase [Mycobacterium sp. MS1601]|uniref:glycosyltransferase family 2 protein n=1 Tax=Mycobacterium sp. MS1601 TaxID=1936029 RepID=UPI0009790CE6|nr:galactosyltransferase-related protein [Mycobacterium sp. MS1601]AQA02178.1 sugar transferase [Mycobacterium sp. MS1601]
MTRSAVITVAHGRHAHLACQEAGLSRMHGKPDTRLIVALDDPHIRSVAHPGSTVVECDSKTDALAIARARNRGAHHALDGGAEVLIFLDVDCIPSSSLVDDYLEAHRRAGGNTLLCGPVTYLAPSPGGYALDSIEELTDPHPARPLPAPGELMAGTDYDLFWSLSFAVSSQTWTRLGGFCEEYTGYGGEDTDFAAMAQAAGVPLTWMGGGHAYHQYHPVSNPPVEHLHDIVANSAVFRRRWGRWPMAGWLDCFERDGLLVRDGDQIIAR